MDDTTKDNVCVFLALRKVAAFVRDAVRGFGGRSYFSSTDPVGPMEPENIWRRDTEGHEFLEEAKPE